MRWLLWRELLEVVRTPPLWVAAVAHVTLGAAFLIVWGDGVPGLRGTVFEQARQIDLAFLTGVLPWVAARCGGPPQAWPVGLAAIGVSLGRTAPVMVATRTIAAASAAAIVAIAGLPGVLVASQIAVAPLSAVVQYVLDIGFLSLFVGAVATATMIAVPQRLGAWITATVVVWVVRGVAPPGWLGTVIALLVGCSAVGIAVTRVAGHLRAPSTLMREYSSNE